MTTKEKLVLGFALVAPAVPAVLVIFSFLGHPAVSILSPHDSAFAGMHPLAALGWGLGIYLADLTLLLLLGILISPGRKKK